MAGANHQTVRRFDHPGEGVRRAKSIPKGRQIDPLAQEEIEKLLGVTHEWNFVDLIPVGYPAEVPKVPPRKPIAEVIQFFR